MGWAGGLVRLVRGFRDYFCCGIAQPLTIWFRSPVHDCNVTNRAGQKGADHVTLHQAWGVSGKCPDIIFSVFKFLGIHSTLILFVPYVSTMGRREGEWHRRGHMAKVGKQA